MANSYASGDAGNYPTRHNKRELKVIETAVNEVVENAPTVGVSSLAALAADVVITATDGLETFIVNDAISITLPVAADNIGRKFTFVQLGTAVLTIAQNADDANIGGFDTDFVSCDAAGDRIEIISTGVEWLTVSSTIA